MTGHRVLGVVAAGLFLVAACGGSRPVAVPGSLASTSTTSTETKGVPTTVLTTLPTTTTTEPAVQLVPIEEIDTGAATDLFFPQTEAEVAAWGDLHNYPPDQPGRVTLTFSGCEVDAPGRLLYHGSVSLEDTERATVGLSTVTFNSPVGTGVLLSVVFTRSGDWTIPIEAIWDLTQDSWGISNSEDRFSRCGVSVFWSDTEVSPDRFVSLGFAEPTYGEFTFRFESNDGDLRGLGHGVRLADLDHPARVWAYVNFFKAPIPFSEVWAPNPSAGVSVSSAYTSDDGSCQRFGISTALGEVQQQSTGCDQALVPEDATATGETAAAGFDIWIREGEWFAVNDELAVVVKAFSRPELIELTGSLQLYSFTYQPAPQPTADSLDALDLEVSRAFGATDEVERGRTPYGNAYLIFSEGQTHVGEQHLNWIRTYRVHFDGDTWVLQQLAEEPWDTCGYTRQADDGFGPYAAVIAGLESFTIRIDDHETEGFWFSTQEQQFMGSPSITIVDPSGTVRCKPSFDG